MQNHHYLAILVALVAGYVLCRFFPQLGDLVGLPKA